MKNNVELMSLYWTTAGVLPGVAEISRFDFKQRVEAAARAGFKGIGLWHSDLEQVMLRRPLQEMKSIMDDNGIQYLELEFLTDWFLEGPRKHESDQRKRLLFTAAEALQASHVKVGDFYNTPCPMPRIVEAFAALCAEAAEHGTTIGFEFMASSMLHTLEDSLAMVQAAGARNGGLSLDIVHVVNLAIPYAAIARIPRQHLISVELNDGTLPGSPHADPSRMRRFCGEGEYDIRGFIQAVRQTGYENPWAVEVMSAELAGLPLEELNRRAYETTLAQFE